MENMERVVIRSGAATDPGWEIKKAAPGHIICTLYSGSDMAQVDIYYDARSYTIKYKDSFNLSYDGRVIHKYYNRWVQNLADAIKKELSGRDSGYRFD